LDSGNCRTEFFIRGMEKVVFHPTLRKAVVSSGRACVQFFALENLHLGPLITTAQRELISEDLLAAPVTARPPCCGQLIPIPAGVADRIERWHVVGDDRGDDAYADPSLLLNCSSCETPLRMNPFFLDVKPFTT
jgi:hypothetical protein